MISSAAGESAEDARGRNAASPTGLPPRAWKAALLRTWKESSADNVGLIAAGVAFYGFLALVPLLGAVVLTYGLFANIQTVSRHVGSLMSVMPADAARLIGEQLLTVVQGSSGKKGLGLLLALAIALFGARNAAGSMITALNIAYEEEERRGFLKVNLIALAITAAAVITFVIGLLGVASLGYLHVALPSSSPVMVALSRMGTYLALALLAAAAAATLYRYGPSRQDARWRWLTPGSLLFAIGWVLLTLGFGFYVANFGDYGATYGSLGAVVVLLTWMYLSAYALLFGAELNSELEHQTARDTTSGPEAPLGQRGAWAADHVADA
jgi:membrane protein